MTTFSITWNPAFLSLPGDTEDESLGAGRIRDFKQAFAERFAVCHSLAGDANDGTIIAALFFNNQSEPPIPTGYSGLYTIPGVAGATNLWFNDAAGTAVPLVVVGVIQSAPPFTTGTTTVFIQSAAPAGWVISTAYNDRVLRLNSTGGDVGGAWSITGISSGSTVLTLDQIPAHDHGLSGKNVVYDTYPNSNVGKSNTGAGVGFSYGGFTTAGGGQGHNHPVSGDGTWRPAYVDAIVCIKS